MSEPGQKSLAALLGLRVREVRNLRRLTQNELGKRIGASGFAVAAYETGRRSPPLEVVAQLARALDVEPWALLSVIDLWNGKVPKAGKETPAARARREHLERLLGAEEFLLRVVEDAHERLDRVRSAMESAETLQRSAAEAPERQAAEAPER